MTLHSNSTNKAMRLVQLFFLITALSSCGSSGGGSDTDKFAHKQDFGKNQSDSSANETSDSDKSKTPETKNHSEERSSSRPIAGTAWTARLTGDLGFVIEFGNDGHFGAAWEKLVSPTVANATGVAGTFSVSGNDITLHYASTTCPEAVGSTTRSCRLTGERSMSCNFGVSSVALVPGGVVNPPGGHAFNWGCIYSNGQFNPHEWVNL